jgi:hypothetical protein
MDTKATILGWSEPPAFVQFAIVSLHIIHVLQELFLYKMLAMAKKATNQLRILVAHMHPEN